MSEARAPAEESEPLRRLHLALTVARHANAGETEAMIALLHPEVEVGCLPGLAPAPGFHGHEGVRQYVAEARRRHLRVMVDITEARATDAGAVLAGGRVIAAVSATQHAMPAWLVYRFRDGRVSAVEPYLDETLAIEQAARG